MEIPESFVYRLLHGTLNDLGLNNVADKLIEEINDKGLYVEDSKVNIPNSSKKVKLIEWFNSNLSNGKYDDVIDYLENNLKIYSTNGDVGEDIGKLPNLHSVLNVSQEIDLNDLSSVVLVIMYLIKRIEFLEKLINFSLNNNGTETNNNLIQFLSDELGPILDTIVLNDQCNDLFDENVIHNLTRELESSKLLLLIMELPLTDFQIENLIFNKQILFFNIHLKDNSSKYLIKKLRQLLMQKYLNKVFKDDFYETSLPLFNYKLPHNFLNKIIEDSLEFNRLKSKYYLPFRSINNDIDDDDEFLPPSESNINNFYKPRFPNKLLHTLSNHSGQVWFTKFSPSGKYLITGAADGKLIIYDVLNNFEVLATLISDDLSDKTAFINSTYKQVSGSKAVIYCCWDPNEEFLVSGSLDTRVRIWDIRNLKNKIKKSGRITRSNNDDTEIKLTACFVLGEKIRTWSCEFLPPNNDSHNIPQFIIGSPDKVLKAYDIFGTELFDFYGNTKENSVDDLTDVKMKNEDDDDESEVIEYEDDEHDVDRIPTRSINLQTSSSSSTNLRDMGSSKQDSFNRINDLSISPDGKILVTANNNKQVDFYTIPNLVNVESVTNRIASINLHGRLTSCSISKNGKFLLLSLGPDELQIWNIENLADTGKPILFKKLLGHSQSTFIIRSCFGYVDLKNNQEELVLSGSDEGDIYIWNLFSGQLINRVKGHIGACNSVDWNTSFVPTATTKDYGKVWCSVGDDKLVKIWGPGNL